MIETATLSETPEQDTIETDLVIIGGGPVGLTLAREFFGAKTNVLVLESGDLEPEETASALSTLENAGAPLAPAQRERREAYLSRLAKTWSSDEQPYGVQFRVLGGGTHAWAGKSAAFDAIDTQARAWVPHSGWPVSRADLDPYLDRAALRLNLGPNCYDDAFWRLAGKTQPQPALETGVLRDFFWQFARSRVDRFDIMRFGPEFLTEEAPNVRVLLNATVTDIETSPDGGRFAGVTAKSRDGAVRRIKARAAVLAAGAVQNPRLLLASNRVAPAGLGNDHDVVGRYLMDHANVILGGFAPRDHAKISNRFGFYGLKAGGGVHMYMHGIALSPETQEREGLLNCSAYLDPVRAPDDPWDALKRLLRRRSAKPFSDIAAVFSSPGIMASGLGRRALKSRAVPGPVKDAVINAVIALRPNRAVEEFQTDGLPHKLTDVKIEAASEQRPDPDSRITLSGATDALGMPRARVDWRINDQERRSLMRLGQLMALSFERAGLPSPLLEPWVAEGRAEDAPIIDCAHMMGTTRMAADPKFGVVDPHCRVHGVEGLYVAGGSVFPTGGHANPTLMMLALAIRLADQLKADLGADASAAAGVDAESA